MSATRRILTVGLPSVAVAAALAFSASPVLASSVEARPTATASPTDDGYTATDNGTSVGGGPATVPTRGHGGYGTPSPSTTPSGGVDTVPATTPPTTPPGVKDTGTPSPSASTGGGVSAGHALAVTGPSTGLIVSFGVLMVAGGAASLWYTRRRRSV
jgi:hypothetical protein